MSGEAEGPTQGDGTTSGDDASWGDLSLEEILARVDTPADPALVAPLTVQEAVARQLQGATVGAVSERFVYSVDDPLAQVLEWVRSDTGRALGTMPAWLRIWRPDLERGVLFVLSAPRPRDEAELVIVSQRGALSRSVMKAACHWAFLVIGVRRVVARVPTDRTDLADLCRRAGFRHEGVARDALGDGLDAGMWAMTARACRWLRSAPSPIPERDFGPIHSLKVH